MKSDKSHELLLEHGFMPEQIRSLHRLRSMYVERELMQMTKEQRRLEFARWLVSTGRLTEGLPETNRC